MKNLIVSLSLVLITCSYAFSQATNYALSNGDLNSVWVENPMQSSDELGEKSYGGFGGPLIRATQMKGEWGVMIGGKGGFIMNQRFAFGGIGMGMASNISFSGDNLEGNANASMNIKHGGGGVFFEYIHKPESPLHFSLPIHIMAGGVSIEEDNTEIESSGIFIIEPGINLEYNLSNNLVPGIHFSYRYVVGSSLENLSNEDLSGIVLGLVLKFGKFL